MLYIEPIERSTSVGEVAILTFICLSRLCKPGFFLLSFTNSASDCIGWARPVSLIWDKSAKSWIKDPANILFLRITPHPAGTFAAGLEGTGHDPATDPGKCHQ